MAAAAVERFRQDGGVRHPRRRGGDLSVRRGLCHGDASGPTGRNHSGADRPAARAQRHAHARVHRYQGALHEAPERRTQSRARRGRLMTAQDTSHTSAALNLASAPPARTAKRFRRLPRQRDWPFWLIVAIQIGVLIGGIALWQAAAVYGWIDAFFWSKPSDVYATLIKFFAGGDAWTDIGYTFQETIYGFLLGTASGSLLGLSFWWSRNYAAVVQPYMICFHSLPKLALAPLVILVFGIGLASKVAIATALTIIVSALTTYAGVKALDPDQERLFYSLGASRMQIF